MQLGINKLIRLLENEPEEQFNAEQYMSLYTCVRERCVLQQLCTLRMPGQSLGDVTACLCFPAHARTRAQPSYSVICHTLFGTCCTHRWRGARMHEEMHERIAHSLFHHAVLRSTIYNMCTQKPPHDYSEQLYAKYREAFNAYITSKVRVP